MVEKKRKTVKLSHLKKLRIKQNIIKITFQVIFIFSVWLLLKSIIVSSTSFVLKLYMIFMKRDRKKIWNILTAQVKFHQICPLISSFCWKYIKKYRRFMCHDNEDSCKIWKKIDLLFEKWQELGAFRSEHWKVSRVCTMIGIFRAKYVNFDLPNYREDIFHHTEDSCKIWRKTDFWFGKWYEEFDKFSPEHVRKSKNLDFRWVFLSKVEKFWA